MSPTQQVHRLLRSPTQPDPWEQVIHDVAALLHAGVPAARAWRAALDAHLEACRSTKDDSLATMLAHIRLTGCVDTAFTEVADLVVAPAATSVFWQARLIWAVTNHTGSPSATTLAGIAQQCQWAAQVAALQRSMLSGPRATVGVLAALLVLGWCGGYALGANPLALLVSTWVGWGLFCVGGCFIVFGVWWGRRLLRWALTGSYGTEGAGAGAADISAAQVCDLVAIALRSGAPLDRAVEAAAHALATCAKTSIRQKSLHCNDARNAEQVRSALRYRQVGMSWAHVATATASPVVADLSRVLGLAETTGAAASEVLSVLADRLRQRALDDARERAGALGVKLALPLGLACLPAYMCWVLVPTLWSLLDGLMS